MTDTSRAPERIWLQDDGEWCQEAAAHGDISWCDHKINDDDTLYIQEDISQARVAAVVEYVAQEVADWGTLHCGHEDVTDEILRDIRALTPADAKAALDRLIREAEERGEKRGAQKEREACAEALWDACPLDQIVTVAYVKRAQDAIRNRGMRDE